MAGVIYTARLRDLISPGLDKIGKKGQRVFSSMDRAQSKMNKSKSRGGGFMGLPSLGTLGKLAGAVGGVMAAFQGAKGIVETGVNMEQARVSFETFLGSAEKANEVIAQLNEFANVTPFDNASVIKAGKVLTAFGVETTELQDKLKAIGDISAGTGKDFNELTTIYGKAKVAGTLYAEDINQLIEAGVPILGEFAKQLGVSESEVKKMASKGKIQFSNLEKAFEDLTGEGGKFGGLMEKQSQTIGGKWSTLQGKLQSIGIKIFDGLSGIFGRLIDVSIKVVDWISKEWNNLIKVFAPIREAVQPIIDAFRKIGDELGFASGEAGVLEGIFNAIGTLLQWLSPALSAIGETVAFLVGKVMQWVKAIYQGIMTTDWLRKSIAGFGQAALDVFQTVLKAAKTAFSGIGDLITGVFTLDRDLIGRGLSQMGSALMQGNAFNLGKTAYASFKEGYKNDLGGLSDFFPEEETSDKKPASSVASTPTSPLAAGTSGGGTKKSNTKKGLSSVSGARGGGRNLTVNITKLVETLAVEGKNMGEVRDNIKAIIAETMTDAVRDFEVSYR